MDWFIDSGDKQEWINPCLLLEVFRYGASVRVNFMLELDGST